MFRTGLKISLTFNLSFRFLPVKEWFWQTVGKHRHERETQNQIRCSNHQSLSQAILLRSLQNMDSQ